MLEVKVIDKNKGERIDKFLAEQLDISRSLIQQLIKEEKILVNNKSVKSNHRLEGDEVINYEKLEKEVNEITAEPMNLDIVYEDEYLLVVNKPSGLVVHPAIGNRTGTLVNGLMAHANSLSQINGEFRPGIVHRIDKDTSGLLVVAKNDQVHIELSKQLKDKTVVRRYIAMVHGNILEEEADIDAPIGRDPKNRKRMTVTATNSKLAFTSFKVLKRYGKYTLIECKLKTGRTHQIRVHLKWIGHPLVGDPVYGPRHTIDTKGQALHAKVLGFIHPVTKEYMEFEAPLPEEFLNTIKIIEEEDGR